MTKVRFYQTNEIEDTLLKYAVIVARYKDKWIFSRHKTRATWEIPGGHREPGEAVEEAARRELWEETGAIDVKLFPVAVYRFSDYGMLFYGEIAEMDVLPPDSEIGEIILSDMLPNELTYPDIQPGLFHEVQKWLTLQSSADEIWDIYDENRMLTGRYQRRGDPMQPGDYHLCVHIWIQNSRGEFLITKRSPNKGFPNMWETTGGSALAGDDSLTAALREVREETGLSLKEEAGQVMLSVRGDHYFCDVWLFRQNFALSDVVLQEGETCDARYAAPAEIRAMYDAGIFVPHEYILGMLEMMGEGV